MKNYFSLVFLLSSVSASALGSLPQEDHRQAHLSIQKNRENLPDLNSQPVLGSVEGYTPNEQAISQTLRPTREFPWTRVNKEGRPTQFQEFYLSGQSNDCAFRGIGFPNRNIAISSLLDHLNDSGDKMGKDELRQFIANDMANNAGISKQVVPQVFPRGLFDSKAALEPDNQTTYLKYISSHNDYMLGFSSNFDEKGNPIIQDKAYGLINALAHLRRVNLYIYEIKQEASRSLWLSHAFTLKRPTSSISLLHKGAHFNRLVLATDSEGLKAAQAEEDHNLDITLKSIRDEGNALGSLEPSEGSSSSSSSPLSSSVSPISSSHAQVNSGSSLERRAEEDNLRRQRSAQRVSASTGEESLRSTPTVVRANRTVRQASEKEIMTFIASYSQERMRNLTREESCEQAYRFLANKTSIEGNFRLMRLALDKDFRPQGKTRSDFLNELIEKGQRIVRQSKRQTKPHHYGQIFLGKLWVQRAEVIERSQKFNAQTRAYDIFEYLKEENKNHRFTRTYLVDLGELLVQQGYVPRGMTQLQAYTYALEVLNSVPRLAGGGVRTQGAGGTDVYSTMHVNRAEVREHTSELTNQAEHQRAAAIRREGTRSQETVKSARPLYHKQNPNVGREEDTRKFLREYEEGERSVSQQNIENDRRGIRGEGSRNRLRRDEVRTHSVPSPAIEDERMDLSDLGERGEGEVLFERTTLGKRKSSTRSDEEFEREAPRSKAGRLHEKESRIPLNQSRLSPFSDSETESDEEIYWEHGFQAQQEAQDEECRRLIALGRTYGYIHNQEQAAILFHEALDAATKFNLPRYQAQAFIGLGNAREGAHNYQKALDILGKNGDPELKAQAFMGLGNYYKSGNVRNDEMAKEYYSKVLSLQVSENFKKKARQNIEHCEQNIRRNNTKRPPTK